MESAAWSGGLDQGGHLAAQFGGEVVAARAERGGDGPQVAGPGRGADQFEGGLLERARDEELVDHMDRPQPFQHRPSRGQRTDPQARRGDLGEGAEMDDDAVRVVGGERGRQRARVLVGEAAREVVLHDERPGVAGDPHHLATPLTGEHGTGRVLEERLADEDPGTGGPQRRRQQLGPEAVRVDRYGDGPLPRRAGDREHPGVGRRLDEDRRTRRRQRPQGRGQRGLSARRDQHVGAGRPALTAGPRDLAGEPGPQLEKPVGGRPVPRPRPASGPG